MQGSIPTVTLPPPPHRATPGTKSALVTQGWGILQVSLVPGVEGGDS